MEVFGRSLPFLVFLILILKHSTLIYICPAVIIRITVLPKAQSFYGFELNLWLLDFGLLILF